MTAGEPGVFVDDAAEQFLRLVVGAAPERVEGAGGGDDGVVVDVEFRGDFREPVGHAGAAGDAVHQALRPFENAGDDALRTAHFPEDVGVDAAGAAGFLVGAAGLGDAALDRVGDQLVVSGAASGAAIDLRDRAAGVVVAVGIDGAERADAARGGPASGGQPVGDRHTLAALDQRENLDATHSDRIDRLHRLANLCAARAALA